MEIEERVRRIERRNRGLTAALFVLCLVLVLWRVFDGLKTHDILVGKQVTTGGIVVMDEIGPHQKPRVQLLPTPTGTLLCFIGADNRSLLEIGIENDPKLGEIPVITFETKNGRQTLSPNSITK
jgi:hypothetical protein